MRPMKLLRDVPTTTGRPIATISSRRRSSSRLCSTVFPKPIPGSSWMRSSSTPSAIANAPLPPPPGDRDPHPRLQKRLDVVHDVVVTRFLLHRARLAEHVHEAAVDP